MTGWTVPTTICATNLASDAHNQKAPTVEQLTAVLHTISQRVASFMERRGLLERDEDNSYLTLDGLDEDPMCACLPWRDFCFLYLHQP